MLLSCCTGNVTEIHWKNCQFNDWEAIYQTIQFRQKHTDVKFSMEGMRLFTISELGYSFSYNVAGKITLELEGKTIDKDHVSRLIPWMKNVVEVHWKNCQFNDWEAIYQVEALQNTFHFELSMESMGVPNLSPLQATFLEKRISDTFRKKYIPDLTKTGKEEKQAAIEDIQKHIGKSYYSDVDHHHQIEGHCSHWFLIFDKDLKGNTDDIGNILGYFEAIKEIDPKTLGLRKLREERTVEETEGCPAHTIGFSEYDGNPNHYFLVYFTDEPTNKVMHDTYQPLLEKMNVRVLYGKESPYCPEKFYCYLQSILWPKEKLDYDENKHNFNVLFYYYNDSDVNKFKHFTQVNEDIYEPQS